MNILIVFLFVVSVILNPNGLPLPENPEMDSPDLYSGFRMVGSIEGTHPELVSSDGWDYYPYFFHTDLPDSTLESQFVTVREGNYKIRTKIYIYKLQTTAPDSVLKFQILDDNGIFWESVVSASQIEHRTWTTLFFNAYLPAGNWSLRVTTGDEECNCLWALSYWWLYEYVRYFPQ